MARIRTVKPEFWESETVGCLTFGARLLFLASLNLADDEGLLRWNTSYLSSHAFMYDDIDPKTVEKWMKELEDGELVFAYKAGKTNQSLGWMPNFLKHQVINRPQPSKLPAPSLQNAKVKQLYIHRDNSICQICKLEIDQTAPLNVVGSKAPSLDHILPQSKGGSDYPSNIRLSHVCCNKSRGNKLDESNTDNKKTNSLNNSVNGSVNYSVLEEEREREKERERERERELEEEVVIAREEIQPPPPPPSSEKKNELENPAPPKPQKKAAQTGGAAAPALQAAEEHLFRDSCLFDEKLFQKRFQESYPDLDASHYYRQLLVYSDEGSKKKRGPQLSHNWLLTMHNFVKNDRKENRLVEKKINNKTALHEPERTYEELQDEYRVL